LKQKWGTATRKATFILKYIIKRNLSQLTVEGTLYFLLIVSRYFIIAIAMINFIQLSYRQIYGARQRKWGLLKK